MHAPRRSWPPPNPSPSLALVAQPGGDLVEPVGHAPQEFRLAIRWRRRTARPRTQRLAPFRDTIPELMGVHDARELHVVRLARAVARRLELERREVAR